MENNKLKPISFIWKKKPKIAFIMTIFFGLIVFLSSLYITDNLTTISWKKLLFFIGVLIAIFFIFLFIGSVKAVKELLSEKKEIKKNLKSSNEKISNIKAEEETDIDNSIRVRDDSLNGFEMVEGEDIYNLSLDEIEIYILLKLAENIKMYEILFKEIQLRFNNIKEIKFQYYLDELIKKDLIYEKRYAGRNSDYYLSKYGKAFLVKNEMV